MKTAARNGKHGYSFGKEMLWGFWLQCVKRGFLLERKGKVIPFRVEGTKIEKALEPTVESLVLHSHCISSVQDGISALGKSYMRSIPSLRSFPSVTFETVPMFVWLTMASLSSFQGRSSSASSVHASLLQAIDGVLSLVLWPQVVSQVSQHFRSSEKQATCEGCIFRQYICLVISFHTGIASPYF